MATSLAPEPVSPPSTPTLNTSVKEAIALYRDGEYSQAIEALAPLLNDETAPEILEPLGLSHFHTESYESAIELFDRLIALDVSPPFTRAAHINRGNCEFRMGQYAAAEASFRSVLDTPSSGTAAYGLACVRALQSRPHEAMDWLEKALKDRPDLKSQVDDDKDLETILRYVRLEKMIKEEKEPEFSKRMLNCVFWLGVVFRGAGLILGVFYLVVPRSWRLAWQRFVMELLYVEKHELHGVRIGVSISLDKKPYLEQIDEALKLINRVWPRCYDRIQQDLDWVGVHRLATASGYFQSTTMACQLSADLFMSTEDYQELGDEWDEYRSLRIQKLASVIVHEACHARMHRMGFQRAKHLVEREEKLCRKQESRFMEKAKSDAVHPVNPNYDADYDRRFGMCEQWYYGWEGSKNWRDRLDDLINTLSSDEAYTYERFLEHVWSDVDHYVEYVQDLRESPQSESKDADAWCGRGQAYSKLMRHADAVVDFQRMVELRPDEGSLLRLLGKAARHTQDEQVAISAFEQSLELDPKDGLSLLWLTPLIARNESRCNESIELSDRLASEYPASHNTLLYQARSRQLGGQLDNALPFVEQAMEYHPECTWGSLLGYEINTELGNAREANACLSNYAKHASDVDYKKRKDGRAVILRSKKNAQAYCHLTLMYSTSADIDAVASLAAQLLEQTEAPPANLQDEYLHSMVRLPFGEADTFKLPKSVAGNQCTWLVEVGIPGKCFDLAGVSPEPLSIIPICYDVSDPTSMTHLLFS